MKRYVKLYIGDEEADLDDQSFILFNWTMEDLTNPTVVKNSYSQQITLPGTARNNRIFGEYFRVDRVISTVPGSYTGVGFDPTRKTPFTIYSNWSEILMSGYVKLNSVQMAGQTITYNVTLYGGLGSFFYSLSYDEEGNKRTLASLDYLGTSDPDSELDFSINADAVQEAWDALIGQTSGKWQVVNFAPCYNGIPDGDFDADKALFKPANVSLPASSGAYSTKSEWSVANLSQEHDEWAVKDLRSYLQRPVFSIKAMFDAISDPDNNGGYDVDLSSLNREDGKPFYQDIWMTLPMFTELNKPKTEIGEATLKAVRPDPYTTSKEITTYTVETSGTVPLGTSMTTKVHFKPVLSTAQGTYVTYEKLYLSAMVSPQTSLSYESSYHTVIFMQLLAYTSENVLVGGGKVSCISDVSIDGEYLTPEYLANYVGYTPTWTDLEDNKKYEEDAHQCDFVLENPIIIPSHYVADMEFSLESDAQDADHFAIQLTFYWVHKVHFFPTEIRPAREYIDNSGSYSVPEFYPYQTDITPSFRPAGYTTVPGEDADSIELTRESSDAIRSNALIKKSTLLTTDYTPADYLLSFCKLFGLHFLYDSISKHISIITRNDLYAEYAADGSIIDLTGRIDASQDMEIVPFAFESKWYDFLLESDGGAFYNNYKSLYGIEYGVQRVNTGYEFEDENVNLMSDNIFRNAVPSLESTRYFNSIRTLTAQYRPSVFVDKGNTYTLWTSEGESDEFNIPCPPDSAEVVYFNDEYNGYDNPLSEKLQLHDSDKKSLDGSNILVYNTGKVGYYPYFKISDDSSTMMALNENRPCWNIDWDQDEGGIFIPVFSRYIVGTGDSIDKSLDFGKVKEFNIPGIKYTEDTTVYSLYWKKYLTDRYDNDTKILRCRVDLSGLPVGQELLRRFYWYQNSLWVLNSISNYSFTTYDTAECEFIQVQDITNYTQGQTIK